MGNQDMRIEALKKGPRLGGLSRWTSIAIGRGRGIMAATVVFNPFGLPFVKRPQLHPRLISFVALATTAVFLFCAPHRLPEVQAPADSLAPILALPSSLQGALGEYYASPPHREDFARVVLKFVRHGPAVDPETRDTVRGIRRLFDFDPLHQMSDEQVMNWALRAFDAVDQDHDGVLSENEQWIPRNIGMVGVLRAGCPIPLPAKDDRVVGITVNSGTLVSTFTVAGQEAETTVIRLNINATSKKNYIFAASRTPVIWQVTGDVSGISTMIVTGPRGADKHIQAGVSGLEVSKVVFRGMDKCLATEPNDSAAAQATLEMLLKRAPDVSNPYLGEYAGFQLATTLTADAKTKPAGPPEGFDTAAWSRSLMYSDGLAPLSGNSIISDEVAEPYNVLPGWAGISQLAHDGVLALDDVRPVTDLRVPNDGTQAIGLLDRGKLWIKKEMPEMPAALSGADFMLLPGVKPPPIYGDICLFSAKSGTAISSQPFCKDRETPLPVAGPENTCRFKGDAAFAETLQKKYQEYRAMPAYRGQDLFRYDRISGTDAADAFLIPSGQNAAVTGKAGDDVYFLPLRKGVHRIIEKPSAAETNTLVFADVSSAESPAMVLERDANDLRIRAIRGASAFVTIENWFVPGKRKPVACLAFPPKFDMISAYDAGVWAHELSLREPRPPETHIITEDVPRKRIVKPLPPGTELQSLSADQSASGTPPPLGMNGQKYGQIQVRVWPGKAPVLLMLGAYQPVHWQIIQTNGATIAAILLTGEYRQTAEINVAGVPVYNVSGSFTAENIFLASETMDRQQKQWISAVTGIPPTLMHFQNMHETDSFDVK